MTGMTISQLVILSLIHIYTAAIYHKNIYLLLLADDVMLTVYKITSFNIRSTLMTTLDRSVEKLSREYNHCVAIAFVK